MPSAVAKGVALLVLFGGVSPAAGQSTGDFSSGDVSSGDFSSVSNSTWAITSGSQWCSITSNGECVTDGAGNYGDNERCTIRAEQSLYATATYFDTESCCDYMMIAGTRWSGSTRPVNIAMAAGATMTWWSPKLWLC